MHDLRLPWVNTTSISEDIIETYLNDFHTMSLYLGVGIHAHK